MVDVIPWIVGALILNALVTAALIVLVLGAYHEIRRLDQLNIGGRLPSQTKPSRLRTDETFPSVGVELADPSVLLFLAYGCSPCAELARKIDRVELEGWRLVVFIRGVPSREPLPVVASSPLRPDGTFDLPAHAVVVSDPAGKWFRDLEIRTTPTAIAVRENRVHMQQVAPAVDWFNSLLERKPLTATTAQTVGGDA